MNGRKAKRLRREVYGDMSLKEKGYSWSNGVDSPIIRDPLRRAYQKAKKQETRGRRGDGVKR